MIKSDGSDNDNSDAVNKNKSKEPRAAKQISLPSSEMQ